MQFVIKWITNTIALFIVIHVVAGVGAADWQTVIVAAFVIGLFNAFLKPVVLLLTLPINLMSLGIFTLFVNGAFFYLASKFVKGFTVVSFWNAFWASIVFSIISFLLSTFLTPSVKLDVRTFTGRAGPGRSTKRTDVIDVEAHIEDGDKSDD
jgi:putative membrane protein